jgi:hypothetical protein
MKKTSKLIAIAHSRLSSLELGEGELTKEEIEDGWHFCCDWDGMLIHPELPEGDCCNCKN